MGRHSDGKPNNRVAMGPLIMLLAIIVIAAAIFAWFAVRDSRDASVGSTGGQCAKGDLTFVVSADPASISSARDQVKAWGDTNPVVRDYCVRPQLTVAGSEKVLADLDAVAGGGADAVAPVLPTVWAPADASFVDRARDSGVVGIGDDRIELPPEPAGIAVRDDVAADLAGATWSDIAGRPDFTVATPGGTDAVVSSVVNAQLNPEADADALRAAAEPRINAAGDYTSDSLMGQLASDTARGFSAVAATESMVEMAEQAIGEGLTFIELAEPAGSASFHAPMVAFTSGGPIDETAARAAAEFIDFAKDNAADGSGSGSDSGAGDDTGSAASPLEGAAGAILPDLAARQSNPLAEPPAPGPAEAAGPGAATPGATAAPGAAAAPGSTLVLLDASTATDLPAVREAIIPLLDRAADGEGRRVALWNFSSPVSAGVTSPVRPNVYFGPGDLDASKRVLGQIGTVGEPWLWRSIVPAHQYARDTWVPDVTNRVVLVTSGSDATGDDPAAAIEAIKVANGEGRPVRIDVVTVGEDTTGSALRDLAAATGGSVYPANGDLSAALSRALGL